MGGLFGGSKMPAAPEPPPVPTIDADPVAKAAEQERRRRQQAGGRASTILYGGQSQEALDTAKKKLLGQ